MSNINIYVYDVEGPPPEINKNLNKEYYFKPLSIKDRYKNKKNKPISIRFNNIFQKNQSMYFFSKNIIKNTNEVGKEIQLKNDELIFFYNQIYKEYPARIKIPRIFSEVEPNKKNIKKLINNEKYKEIVIKNMVELIEYNEEIFKKYTPENFEKQNEDYKEYSDIIYKIDEKDNTKIIVIGDNHGGFHSFFRIILRLYIYKIIDEKYKLNENYKIILLGDLIDRGNYGTELLYLLLKLMKANNSEDELKVILIRGNHETIEISSKNGFQKEINTKFNQKSYNTINGIFQASKNTIYWKFINFFYYCPSAIILNHNNTRYWLCHGGFPINPKKQELIKKFSINKEKSIIIDNTDIETSEIKWNDFTGGNDTYNATFSRRNKRINIIGIENLKKFLKNTKINFIIRGHTDSIGNAILLSNKQGKEKFNPHSLNSPIESFNEYYFMLNLESSKNLITEQKITTEVLEYNKNINFKNNYIATIKPNNFKSNSIFNVFRKKNETEFYPVLTISNNCDIQRNLYPDSYVVICKKEVDALKEVNPLKRYIKKYIKKYMKNKYDNPDELNNINELSNIDIQGLVFKILYEKFSKSNSVIKKAIFSIKKLDKNNKMKEKYNKSIIKTIKNKNINKLPESNIEKILENIPSKQLLNNQIYKNIYSVNIYKPIYKNLSLKNPNIYENNEVIEIKILTKILKLIKLIKKNNTIKKNNEDLKELEEIEKYIEKNI